MYLKSEFAKNRMKACSDEGFNRSEDKTRHAYEKNMKNVKDG